MSKVSVYKGVSQKSGKDYFALKVNGTIVTFDLAKIAQAIGIEKLANIQLNSEIEV